MIFWMGGGGTGGCWQELGLGPTSWFKQIVAINVFTFFLNFAKQDKMSKDH